MVFKKLRVWPIIVFTLKILIKVNLVGKCMHSDETIKTVTKTNNRNVQILREQRIIQTLDDILSDS